jgi:hypothetical protein
MGNRPTAKFIPTQSLRPCHSYGIQSPFSHHSGQDSIEYNAMRVFSAHIGSGAGFLRVPLFSLPISHCTRFSTLLYRPVGGGGAHNNATGDGCTKLNISTHP